MRRALIFSLFLSACGDKGSESDTLIYGEWDLDCVEGGSQYGDTLFVEEGGDAWLDSFTGSSWDDSWDSEVDDDEQSVTFSGESCWGSAFCVDIEGGRAEVVGDGAIEASFTVDEGGDRDYDCTGSLQ